VANLPPKNPCKEALPMAKRNKHASTTPVPTAAPIVAHPPTKNPSLLAVSLVLFALWFVFLLVAAIWQ
jgi:hypothetical protein